MDEFISADILGTMAGCSFVVTLLTQIFKKFMPETMDTKWLALIFSICIGILRIFYVGQFDFGGIASGILNMFMLVSSAIGVYEISKSAVGGAKNGKKRNRR